MHARCVSSLDTERKRADNPHMDKKTALSYFDDSVTRAAAALGITHSAISQWPNDGPIPDSARNRVEAWLWRRSQSKQRKQHAKEPT